MTKVLTQKIPLAETSRAEYSGMKMSCEVYVTGKGTTPFILPKKVAFDCSDIDLRPSCALCSLSETRWATMTVDASSRKLLEMLDKADSTVTKVLRHWFGVCDACDIEVRETQNVEELRVSPRVDTFTPNAEYVSRECFYTGHGLKPNRPYELVCYSFPSPAGQRAVLVAESATPLRDMIENFDVTKVKDSLNIFKGDPHEIFPRVYDDLSCNVHRIFGRYWLQVAYDLSFHSVLQFKFQDVLLRKGWVEAFILGDSGQGKTEMSLCLLNHYGLGDRIQGEGASTAGIIGGLEKVDDRWMLVWGRVPQMDKKLLIIDEFSGISEEDVAKLSDIRSTGIAEITKIRTERASARTRLIMMSNT